MNLRLLAYFCIAVAGILVSWRLREARPTIASALCALFFTMLCQAGLVFLHQKPVQADSRAETWLIVANRLPLVAVVIFPLITRSTWRGAIGAAAGVGLGFIVSAVTLHALGLVKIRLYL
ncbi:MAG: hypothetical protein IPK33_03075 [Gemmatimonadetes bacterium]|nr:hypothetical protein [Gemmatimonadota bacterium]